MSRINLTERILHLRGFPIFAELPPRVVQAIANAATAQSFDRGETIFRRGAPYEYAVLVTHGRIGARKEDATEELPPKSCVGIMGLLAHVECAHDIVALTEARGLVLTGDALFDLMEEHSPILRALSAHIAGLAADLERTRPENVNLGTQTESVSERVSTEPLNPIERISFLRELPPFARSNLASLMTLSRLLREVRFEAGQTLWRTGDTAETSFIVIDGSIDGILPDGRKITFGAGTSAGGIEGLANLPRWYDAVTTAPVVALEGRTEEFMTLLEDDFAMAMSFLGTFAGGLLAELGLRIEPRRA